MALKEVRTEHTRTVGHVSHEAQVRVDKRVGQILARRVRRCGRRGSQPGASSVHDRVGCATRRISSGS